MRYYKLGADGEPVRCGDVIEWAEWLETASRSVDDTRIDVGGESVRISTVFLGIDHNFGPYLSGDSTPVLWETMIFGGPHDGYQRRYTSLEEAKEGHKWAVAKAEGRKAVWWKMGHKRGSA